MAKEELSSSRKSKQKLRSKLIEKLGGKCIVCGWDDHRALQIDHINGGGRADREAIGRGHGHSYLLHVFNDPNIFEKYQLLCCNHNWIKVIENKEYYWHGKPKKEDDETSDPITNPSNPSPSPGTGPGGQDDHQRTDLDPGGTGEGPNSPEKSGSD